MSVVSKVDQCLIGRGGGGGGCAGFGMSVVSKVDECLMGDRERGCRCWNVCCKQS